MVKPWLNNVVFFRLGDLYVECTIHTKSHLNIYNLDFVWKEGLLFPVPYIGVSRAVVRAAYLLLNRL